MSEVLLLTKNTFHELAFEQKLKELGHEVFTSTTMFYQTLNDKLSRDFLSVFRYVIISETIGSKETACLVTKMKDYPMILLRKTDEVLDEKQSIEWKEDGLDGWIGCNPELEVLRDQLANDSVEQVDNIIFDQLGKKKKDISSLSLSAGELRMLKILYKQQKTFISREDLCMKMWGKHKSNSTMSQLSTLVKNLKYKLTDLQIEGEIIETSWGRGYRLAEQSYHKLCVDDSIDMIV